MTTSHSFHGWRWIVVLIVLATGRVSANGDVTEEFPPAWRTTVATSLVTGIAVTSDGKVAVIGFEFPPGFRVTVLDDHGDPVSSWTSDVPLGRPSAMSDGRLAVPATTARGQTGWVDLYESFSENPVEPRRIDLVAGAHAMAVGEENSLLVALATYPPNSATRRELIGMSWVNAEGEVEAEWMPSGATPSTADITLTPGPVRTKDGIAWSFSVRQIRRHLDQSDSVHSILASGVPSGLAAGPGGGVYWVRADEVGYYRLDASLAWMVEGLNPISGPVLTAEGLVVVGTGTGRLLALGAEGEVIWETEVGSEVDSDPVVTADGEVWGISRNGRLVRVNALTGELKMAIELGIRPTAALRLSPDGLLYVGTETGELLAFHVGSGPAEGVWAQEGGDSRVSRLSPYAPTPLIQAPVLEWVQDTNFVGNQLVWESVPGAVAYELWKSVPGDTDGAALHTTVIGSLSYVDTGVRRGVPLMYQLRALDKTGQALASEWIEVTADTRQWEWSVMLPVPNSLVHGLVILSDDSVVVTVAGGGMVGNEMMCYSALGELQWRKPFERLGTPPVVGVDDVIHVVDNVNNVARLIKLNAEGEELTHIEMPRAQGGVGGGPFIGRLAVDPAGNTLALGDIMLTLILADGTVAWSQSAGGAIPQSAPAIHANGSIVYNHESFIARRTMDGRVLVPIPFPRRSVQMRWEIALGRDNQVHRVIRNLGFDTWDNASNTVRTTMSPGGVFGSVAATADGSIYGIGPDSLVAWDEAGQQRWRLVFPPPEVQVPVVNMPPGHLLDRMAPTVDGEGNVMVSYRNRLLRVNSEGELQGITHFDHTLTSNPILSESGRVYVTGISCLHALSSPAGMNPNDPWPMDGRDRRASCCITSELPDLTVVDTAKVNVEVGQVRVELEPTPVPVRHEILRSSEPDPDQAEVVGTIDIPGMLWETEDAPPDTSWYYWIRQVRGEEFGSLGDPFHVGIGSEWIRWRAPLRGASLTAVAINPLGGRIHVTGNQHNFIQTFTSEGELEWEVDLGNRVPHQPLTALDGSVRVVTTHEIVAIDSAGDVMWRAPRMMPSGQNTDVVAPAISRNGNLHAGRGDGALMTVSEEGEILWECEAGASLVAGPLVLEDGAIAVATQAGAVIVLEPDGEFRWRVETERVGTAILGSYVPGKLAHSSSRFWQEFDVETGEGSELEMDGIGAWTPLARPDGKFWFNFREGAQGPVQTWTFNGEQRSHSIEAPDVESRAVSADGGLVGVRVRDVVGFGPDGELRWQIFGYPNGYPPNTSPALSSIRLGQPVLDRDGRVYFTLNSELICVQTSMALASTRWPMAQGSVRRSASLEPPQRDVVLRILSNGVSTGGEVHFDLEIDADTRDGVELWRSGDMRHWRRAGYWMPGWEPMVAPRIESDSAGYFRAIVP